MEFKTVIQAIREKKMKVRQQWSDGFFGNLGRDEKCQYYPMYQKMKDDAEAQERELDEAEKFLHALQQNKEQQPQLPQAPVSLSLPPRSEVEKWFTGQDTVEDKYWHEAPYRTNGDVFEQVYDALEYYMRGGNAS